MYIFYNARTTNKTTLNYRIIENKIFILKTKDSSNLFAMHDINYRSCKQICATSIK